MTFNLEVSITHIITALSVITAFFGLLYKIQHDKLQEQKNSGDSIKTASCQLLGYLERHRYIYSSFYDDIQPTLTEVDALGLRKEDWYKIRDFCWVGMVKSRTKIMHMALSDKIEIEVINTWTVKKGLNTIFSDAIRSLKKLDMHYYLEALHNCQDRIKAFNYEDMNSSELGNAVRDECDKCLLQFANKSEMIIDRVKEIISRIIEIDSVELAREPVEIPEAKILFKDILPVRKFKIPI
jgi:hypothetical protein